MAEFKVTPQTLADKAGELSKENEKFVKAIDELVAAEKGLDKTWEGASKDAFHNEFMKDVKVCADFSTLVLSYCHTLEDIAKQYNEAEKTNFNTASVRTAK